MNRMGGKAPTLVTAGIVLTAIFLVAGWSWQSIPNSKDLQVGHLAVEKAYHDKDTDLMVEVDGHVTRLLQIDRDTPGTQRFLIRMQNGQVLMIMHDHGRGSAIPLSVNDEVEVRGIYSWSETGGTIHHTRRDMSLSRHHGWVEHNGKKYQ